MKVGISMYEYIHRANVKNMSGPAIYYQGTTISFRRFFKRIDRMADILSNRLNVQKDDVVMVAQPNIPDTLVLVYALNKIGAIVNLVHPFTPYNQIRKIIETTGCKYAFLFEQRVAKEVERYRDIANMVYVTRIEDDLPLFKKFAYHTFMNKDIRKTLGRFRGKFKGFNYIKDLKPTHKPLPEVDKKSSEISMLLHSGSTTGDPKTICLCDDNFNAIAENTDQFLSVKNPSFPGRYFINILPSFHGFGMCVSMHMPLAISCGVAMVPKYSPKEAAKICKKLNVFCITGVPTIFETLANSKEFCETKGIKNIYVCYCGGDSLAPITTERFNAALARQGGKGQVFEGYGLTEAVAVNCVNTFDAHKPGSIGLPMHGADFKIFDENMNEVPTNEIGEIAIKSDAVMVGYYKDEENTKKTIVNGYLLTGDYGRKDEDGFIFFAQRKKRVVKVSGVGVFPTEVEKLVQAIPGVEKACAIQIPDPKLQHALKLFVVAKHFDEQGMKDQILDTCRKYLIRWSVPKEIEFIDEMPMTMMNKVDFRKLQDLEDTRRGIK